MNAPTVTEISRRHNPFPRDGVVFDGNGVPRYRDLPESLPDMLKRHVDERPDSEAVVELGGERLSYRELWNRSARVAGGLRADGLVRGERVAIRYPAGTKWVVAFWGVIMAGGVAVAVNTRSTASEARLVLDDADVRFDLNLDVPLPDGDPYVEPGLGLRDVAAMFYTSGTSGRPKGVPTTHEAFLTSAENLIRCGGIPGDAGADLRTLISVPLFHVTGCNSQLLVAARVGGVAIIMPVLNQAELISAIESERITCLVTVPAVYALIARHPQFATTDVSQVRWLGYGGAPIAPSLVVALQNSFPRSRVFNGYGMTETASTLTMLPHEEAAEHADSVGYAAPAVDLGIVPIGDNPAYGELVVRGAGAMTGYWRSPEATAGAFVDGWLRTGDVVRVDAAGRVHIVDRIKDIVNRGGENISSTEVEGVLVSAPDVLEAAVLAVPDDVMGEKVGAVLYSDGPIDVQRVLAHCRTQLADFKVPQYIFVSSTPLPRNAGGKLLKAQLRGAVKWGAPLR